MDTNMNSTNNNKGISFFLSELSDKDRSIFERVIAFNITNGLNAHYSNELATANIIITNESNMPKLDPHNTSILLVIGTDISLGDIQVSPPLLITRVMKSVEKAIKLVATNTIQTAPAPAAQIPQEQQVHKNYHSLVIDDSAAIRKQLELELRDAGISSDFAESGEQALEKAKDSDFDIIFLDIIMPGMDGYETCKALRATAKHKKTPIIMLSGKSSPLDEVEGVIAGATCYLTKPVKSDMLQQTLNRVTKWIDNFSDSKKEKVSATS